VLHPANHSAPPAWQLLGAALRAVREPRRCGDCVVGAGRAPPPGKGAGGRLRVERARGVTAASLSAAALNDAAGEGNVQI